MPSVITKSEWENERHQQSHGLLSPGEHKVFGQSDQPNLDANQTHALVFAKTGQCQIYSGNQTSNRLEKNPPAWDEWIPLTYFDEWSETRCLVHDTHLTSMRVRGLVEPSIGLTYDNTCHYNWVWTSEKRVLLKRDHNFSHVHQSFDSVLTRTPLASQWALNKFIMTLMAVSLCVVHTSSARLLMIKVTRTLTGLNVIFLEKSPNTYGS